jgi:paraquat-inducible protein A
MHDYGRWAMLDVMVVAVLIVASKLSVLASVEVHVGLYVFGLSVILVMLLTQSAIKLTDV